MNDAFDEYSMVIEQDPRILSNPPPALDTPSIR